MRPDASRDKLAPTGQSTDPHSMHTSKDPLHGITLEKILLHLVEKYGWKEMGRQINIRCFNFDPSIKSSLTFLRKTPWARKEVEELYVRTFR